MPVGVALGERRRSETVREHREADRHERGREDRVLVGKRVFLFEDEETLRAFIDKGWHADATATAALGSKGSNAEATFSHGVAVYQLTNKGLMAHADISGTKYWKNKKLNEVADTGSRRAGR